MWLRRSSKSAAGRGCPTGFDISSGSLIGELHIVHSVYDSSVFDDEDADGIARC